MPRAEKTKVMGLPCGLRSKHAPHRSKGPGGGQGGEQARVREAENALGLSRDSPPRADPAVVQRPRGRLALLEAAQPQLCDTGKVNSPFWVYYFFNHKVLMETTATKQSRYENKRS